MKRLLLVIALAFCCPEISADTLYVPSGQYSTIQSAIDDSNDWDVVIVADGTYTGLGNKDIDFNDKAITVQSENGPQLTIIDCENSGRGFYFHSGEDANSVLTGFTITKGTVTNSNAKGGGIYCSGSSPTIENCIITGNDANWGSPACGGGIYCESNSNPVIKNCAITYNKAIGNSTVVLGVEGEDAFGGGIYSTSDCHLTIENCTITNNSALGGAGCASAGPGGEVDDGDGRGGGIYAKVTISNSTITDNSAEGGDGGGKGGNAAGGGMYCLSGSSVINCLIVDNQAIMSQSDADCADWGGGVEGMGTTTLINCILWGNGDDVNSCSATYCCIEDQVQGQGNIHSNPMFVDADSNDFHLWYSSQCIDAGDPCSDYSNEPNGGGGRINMGVYGNTSEATTIVDDDSDGISDEWERYYFPGSELNQVSPNADADDDGLRNIDEYHIHWDPNNFNSFDGIIHNNRLDVNYPSISLAIDIAKNGDTLIVDANTFYETINFNGKPVTLTGTDPNDPDVVATTIIDGSNPVDPNIGSVVTFKEGENANSVLTGFTIQNGTGQTDPTVTWRSWDGENGDGGGAHCSNASPTITKNIFKNCRAEYGGGGIFCHNGASPVITHNTFVDNYAGWYGGGVFARASCSPTISNNIFKYNTAHYIGGAIYLAGQCYSKVTNNWFEKNDSERMHGGAIYYFVNCSPIIACNFFIGNTCSGPAHNNPTGSAILFEAGTAGKIINNLFTGNTVINTHIWAATITNGGNSTDLIANNIIYDNNNVGIYTWQAGTVIKNNDVWANAAGNYGGVTGDLTGTNGNISVDPQVLPAFPEPLTLHELHPNSPCIDAGANDALEGWLTEDYDGTSRTVNGVVDMGPQEYKPIVVPIDYSTIQEAINDANDGDEIIVLPGFYQENVNFLTKNIRLRSLNPFDPCTVAQTIIDGNDEGSCISILSGQNDSTIVAGLWLQNGYSQFGGGIHVGDSVGPVLMYNYITSNDAWSYGGGVDCRNNAYAEVLNNTIIDNDACTAGGGVHVGPWSSCLIKNNRIENNFTSGEAGAGIYTYDEATAWIINNVITANRAITAWGGGIWQWDSPGGVIEGNIITGNITTATYSGHGDGGRGGGIGIMGNSNTLIRNNIICGNKADEGGGIWVQGTGNAKVSNNTIVGNTAEYAGSGIAIAYLATYSITNNIITDNGTGGGVYVKPSISSPAEPNLMNNNVWNNQGGNYIGDINDLTGIEGNISADPCLLVTGYWADVNDANVIVEPNDPNATWVFGDYHIPYFSPCRDAGISLHAPLTDFNENPRPHFDGFDIGAYELQIYDLSANGTVDFTDLLLLVNTWLTQAPSIPADLNTDGIVDVRDFVLLGGDWAKQN